MSNEFKLSANDISALKMLGLGDNIANIEKQIGKMPSVLRRQKENEINKLYKNEPRKAKKALAEYDYNVALNSGDADAIKQSGKNLAKAEQEAAADISTLSRTANAIQKGSQAWVDFFPWANQKIAQGAKWLDDKGVPFLGDMGREIHKALDSADTLNAPLNKINPLIAIPEMLNRAVGNEPSKKESDKERLARPNKLKEQQEILDRAYHTENPNSWNIAGTAGEFLAPAELATFAINAPIKTGGNFASRVLPNFYKNALVASAVDLPANASDSKNLSDFGTRAGLGLVGGGLLGAGIGEIGNKIANRSANKIVKTDGTEPNSPPNTPNSSTAPNSAPNTPNSNADDLATNGIWLGDGSTPPPNGGLVRGDNFVTDPNSANVEQNIVANFELSPNVRDLTKISTDEISADLSHLSEKHPEMFEKASDVFKLIKEIKDEPQFFYRNNRLDGALIAKRLQEQGKIGKVVVNKENGEVIHATKAREQDLARLERVANKNDERVRALSAVSSRKVEQGGGLPSETIPQHPLNTADDIIDLVPDENGVYKVVYNGSSKELAKIATEIAKGEIQSMGAKRLVYIADNIAETAAKDAEQKISANIAKIDNDSVELYANNTALLGDIAKKYPMLNKDEQIELLNKQILANASAELLEYSKFLNGGTLPNDARLLGKNAGRMILKSLNAGAEPAEIVDMLIKAGISGRNSTAAKALLQTRDINAYNAQMRKAEAELIAELSNNVRTQAKNESIGAILGSAKEKAIKNDELLKKGVGNQGLDDVINTFKSSKSGKEFEVAENGFGRELLSYDGVAANEEMKRAFLAWEAQEKKADITLHDGRKVVFLEPDEAVQLSYGNSYLYGEKDLEALFARRRAESLEQKLKRLQSHPAYENLLKMRENTKASELKGDTVGGSKPTVFYEPQSERYLRTQGGGGLPNAERSITITKADVAKLRAGKANEALATKLENNLEALTGDPAASGLIDDLLTRDYHLASAAKKSELVAPKNADEVAKSAENTQRNSKILTNQDIKEQISKWDLSAPKQTLITNKIDGEELEKLNEHFKFKGNYALTRQIDSEHIKHALSHHGDEKIEALRGQKAITLDDIANYENYAKTADIKEYIDKKVISKKQINGHFVVVEEALTGKNRLNFVSMWYVKGKIKDVAPVSTPKNDLDRTLSNRYDSANSSKDEIKSQEQLSAGLKRGFSTAEMPSAMLGGAAGHMAGSAIGAGAGEYESEGGVAGAIIGALAGLASPKAAAKIAAKMIAKKASKIELMPNMPFKEAQDKVQKDLMKYVGVDIKNADSGIVAQINNNGAKKIVSNDAIQKSRNNKFSAGEHLSVAQKTPELFKDATFIGRYDDIKNGESSVKILRFAKNIEVKGKNAVAIITAKESVDKDLKRIYSMELEELRKAELKFGNYDKTQTPASKPLISQDNGVVNSVAPIKDGANSTPKKLLSQEQKRTGLKRGFSTQALNELMLGLGSGGANAMAEDDPNKKAEAFIKGFLAGFGGAKVASMLAKNAPKLAPQLARASEKMASDFPRLLNDRPDILGGVLGRMNNAKDKFSFIFGGEKALGANKAKLKTARDMAKNGAKDDEIWAKTGWYKDIDGKWKFEINAEGGKLKELNAPELDEATKIIKRDYFDKQMNLKELEDFIQFKNGYIDFDAIKKFYDLPKDMSKGELTQKFPYFKMSVNDYMEHGFYKDIDLLHDEIMPARKILNQEYSKTPLNEVLDDPELFASYPQLKDVKVSVDELAIGQKAHFNPSKNEIVLSSALDAEDMKSSLYHEIQHKIQEIEGFGAGGNTQKLSYQEYKNLAGESEARNVQKRLNRTYSKNDAIDGEFNRLLIKDMDNPKWQELKQKRRELILAGKLDEADKIKKQLDQRQEFLKREAVKNVKEFSSYSPHPFNTLDINPNDRIVKYDSGMNASLDPRQKEMRGVYNVTFNDKKATYIKTDLENIDSAIRYANSSRDKGAKHIKIRHLTDKTKTGYITNEELMNLGNSLREYIKINKEPFIDNNGARIYEWENKEGVRFRVVADSSRRDATTAELPQPRASDDIITFYSDRNLKEPMNFKNPNLNSAIFKIKGQELSMRESFSPELKASYDMRDKLLKSTNEVRASLNEKGKAELEKLAGSKDSKLSRDAQIMKTLENAKSNPTRYAKLKKLYLDENGKVKDSIGLC